MEFIMFSESYDDSPVVGSSINSTDDSERKQIQQAMELCMVVDKEKTGKV